ncbi:MAG: hypothetical protein ACRC5A_15515 [Enterobacteriaceae bacterium]
MRPVTGVDMVGVIKTIADYDQSTMSRIADYLGKIVAELSLKASMHEIENSLTENEISQVCGDHM